MIEDAVEKIIQLLKEEGCPFIPEEVQKVVQDRKLETGNKDINAIAQAVLEEGHRRTLEVLGGLQEALGVPLLSRVEKVLPKGGRVFIDYRKTFLGDQVVARVQGQDEGLRFSLPDNPLLRGLEVHLGPGTVSLALKDSGLTSWLSVEKGRVFFKTDNCGEDKGECVRKVLQDAKTLRPLLASMGLSDLEGAVEALSQLDEGESEVEGPYVLARNERAWMLRRGLVFGEPRLDGDLMLEREITLSFPHDVEMSFSVRWEYSFMKLSFLYIRWEREEVLIDASRSLFFAGTLERDPVTLAIRSGLEKEVEYVERGWSSRIIDPSPKMLTFLKALSRHDEPLRALVEGKFLPYVKAELFLDL
jgi:hypothetical protein